MNRLLITALALALPACASATDTISGGEHAGATTQADSTKGTRYDTCDAARQNAMRANGKPVDCVLYASQGLIHTVFGLGGAVVSLTGVDTHNVGRHLEIDHKKWDGLYVNDKNYRGTTIKDTFTFYESQPNDVHGAVRDPNSRTFDGRNDYTLIQTMVVTQKPGDRFLSTDISYPETPTQKPFEDICAVAWGPAETDAELLVSEIGTSDGNNWQHWQRVWHSGGTVPRCTGRYLPYKVDTSFFADAVARFAPSRDALEQNAVAWAKMTHADWNTDPLRPFQTAHNWLQNELHPLGGRSDANHQNTDKQDRARVIQYVIGGIMFVFVSVETLGGADLLLLLAYFLDAAILNDAIDSWGDSPDWDPHPNWHECTGSEPPDGCEYWDTHTPSPDELNFNEQDYEGLALNDDAPPSGDSELIDLGPDDGAGGGDGDPGPGGCDDPICGGIYVGRPAL